MKWTKSLLVQILNVTRLSKITVPLRDSLEIKQLLIFFPAVDECCKSIAMMTFGEGHVCRQLPTPHPRSDLSGPFKAEVNVPVL